MTWRIEFEDSARRELAKLDKSAAKRITSFLRERLSPLDNPRSLGEALRGPKLGAFWKYRVGDYRVIARIDDGAIRILVLQVGHRREVYR